MTYSREDFEDGKCPNCGSQDIDEKHTIFDFPYDKNYRCNDCEAENDDFCFVATVAYGDRNAPQVRTLREFRDNVLMGSSAGRTFVDFYYSGAGKRAAEFIRQHLPSTIPVIRKGLDYLVEVYSAEGK